MGRQMGLSSGLASCQSCRSSLDLTLIGRRRTPSGDGAGLLLCLRMGPRLYATHPNPNALPCAAPVERTVGVAVIGAIFGRSNLPHRSRRSGRSTRPSRCVKHGWPTCQSWPIDALGRRGRARRRSISPVGPNAEPEYLPGQSQGPSQRRNKVADGNLTPWLWYVSCFMRSRMLESLPDAKRH